MHLAAGAARHLTTLCALVAGAKLSERIAELCAEVMKGLNARMGASAPAADEGEAFVTTEISTTCDSWAWMASPLTHTAPAASTYQYCLSMPGQVEIPGAVNLTHVTSGLV